MDSDVKREALVGHTSLCLMSLLGFVLYTATYSVVYIIKIEGKPVAILEMWMVLSHLIISVLCCAIRTLTKNDNNAIAEAQSTIFLAITLSVTGLGTACLQDNLYCKIYYPAAALPSLAASGSIAWAWVMYVVSLGCQSGASVSLGLGKRGATSAAGLMGLVVPQVISTLSSTCPKWKLQCSQGASCNTALNVVFILLSLILSQMGHSFSLFDMRMVGLIMQLVSVAVLWIEILAIMNVGKNGGMGIYIASMVILTIIPLIDVITSALTMNTKRLTRLPTTNKVKKTAFRFPQLINEREHDL